MKDFVGAYFVRIKSLDVGDGALYPYFRYFPSLSCLYEWVVIE